MNKKWVLLGTIFILAFTATISLVCYKDYTQSQKPVQSAIITPQTPLDANKILELVNIERAKVNVAPLTSDPRLVASAQAKADEMVQNDYFGHVSPITGKRGIETIAVSECTFAGENLNTALGNEETVQEWVASKTHYEAMINPVYQITGIGISWQGNYYIVTQHFCKV